MEVNDYNIIGEIRQKLKMPWKPFNWAFFLYLIFILIGIGGLGIWTNLYNATNLPSVKSYAIAVSIATFSITLLARTYIDLNLSVRIKNRLSMQFLSFIFIGAGVVIFWQTNIRQDNTAFVPAGFGFALAIFTWYIANADNPNLNDKSYNEQIREEARRKHGQNWDI